ncbi:MAG TPA: nucleotidyltransferase family protein [Croceibacterium sp.]|jgi:hypothetical protein
MTRESYAELDLAIACCRWPRSPARDSAIRDAAARVSDWEQFERVVARHRIAPLVRDGLSCATILLPPAIDERLSRRAADRAIDSLVMARESVRLQRAMRAAGIPALILKGAAVGYLAYGDVGMKESWDIDLLTSPENAAPAHALLQALGYRVVEPAGLASSQFERFTRYAMEAVYRDPATGLSVELHWRVARNRTLLPGTDVHSPAQSLPFAGDELLTFDDDTLFAYLCVHGTRHGWARLKWLADFAALIAPCSPAETERRYRAAVAAGAGRAPAVTLLLCRHLFDSAMPADLARELEGDRLTRFLALAALALMRDRQEPPAFILPPWQWFFSRFLLVPGTAYLRTEIHDLWNRPIDRARFGAPLAGSLFHLVRLPLSFARLMGRVGSRLTVRAKASFG